MERKKAIIIVEMIVGVCILAAGVKMFYEPNQMVAGGISGLGIVLNYFGERYFEIPVPLWLSTTLCNIPLFLLGWKKLGHVFLWRAVSGALLFSVALFFADFLPQYQGDQILVALYGGVLSGIGAGLVLRSSSSTGGTDLAALLAHHFVPQVSVANFLFFLDGAVILLGIVTFGLEKGLYALFSVYLCSKCVDFLLAGVHFSKGAFIISEKSKEIADALLSELGRGVTAFSGRGMYTGTEKQILLCVFSQKEIVPVKSLIMEVDKDAFLILTDMREVLGEGFSKY